MIILTAILASVGCFVWFLCGLYYLFGKKKPHEQSWKKSKMKRLMEHILDCIVMGPFGVVFMLILWIWEE